MDKRTILKLTNEELRIKAAELDGWENVVAHWWSEGDLKGIYGNLPGYQLCDVPDYTNICPAMTDLFESVYGRGKIKDVAWVLGTVENGRDCAHACLMWKSKSFTKFRPLQVSVTCPRGQMARAITLCWVCAMLGVSDE